MPNVGKYRGVSIYYDTARDRHRMWYTDNKKNKKPVYGKTKDDVKKSYDEVQERLRKGTYIVKKPDTFIQLMGDMLDELEKDRDLKDNSLNRKHDTAAIIEEFIKCTGKQIKNITADELNEDLRKIPDIKKFVQSKNREEYRFSQSYINKIYSLIRETYHYAVLKEKLPKDLDPFEIEGKIKKPKSNKNTKVIKSFSRNECIKFLEELNKCDHKFADILRIQLFRTD